MLNLQRVKFKGFITLSLLGFTLNIINNNIIFNNETLGILNKVTTDLLLYIDNNIHMCCYN